MEQTDRRVFLPRGLCTGQDTESTHPLFLSPCREQLPAELCEAARTDQHSLLGWVFFPQVAADKKPLYWRLFSPHLHSDRQIQTHWRLRHTQLCCLQPPTLPYIAPCGLMCPSFLAAAIPKPSCLCFPSSRMQPAEHTPPSQSPHQGRRDKNALPALGKLTKPTGISGIRMLCITAVLGGVQRVM